MLLTPLFPNNYHITILIFRSFVPGLSRSAFIDHIGDFESCMWSIMQSGRWPGNEAKGTRIKGEEAAASSAHAIVVFRH